MRNRLVHGYDDINADAVWDVVTKERLYDLAALATLRDVRKAARRSRAA